MIAIFTKFDGLINEAFTELRGDGLPRQAAMSQATEKAKRMLIENFEAPLILTEFPLADRVQLDGDYSSFLVRKIAYLFVIDMRAETSSCNELIAKTANALSDDTLRLLFVSVQKNNIYLSVRYALAV